MSAFVSVCWPVAVLDVLPSRVASVFFFHNPDLRHLQLGKLSALLEICMTLSLVQQAGALKYYDMNYYVHQCPAMVYKRHYKPSELLCPVHRQWVLLDDVVQRLDDDKYAALADVPAEEAERAKAAEATIANAMLDDLFISIGSSVVPFSSVSREGRALLRPAMHEFALVVGPAFAQRLLIDPRLMLVRVPVVSSLHATPGSCACVVCCSKSSPRRLELPMRRPGKPTSRRRTPPARMKKLQLAPPAPKVLALTILVPAARLLWTTLPAEARVAILIPVPMV